MNIGFQELELRVGFITLITDISNPFATSLLQRQCLDEEFCRKLEHCSNECDIIIEVEISSLSPFPTFLSLFSLFLSLSHPLLLSLYFSLYTPYFSPPSSNMSFEIKKSICLCKTEYCLRSYITGRTIPMLD